jgi:hypothetical protein
MDEYKLRERGEWAFVWSREQGHKIIIVVDDAYDHVGVDEPYPAEATDAHGLYAIFLHAREWQDIRAVGYFLLPPSTDLIDGRLLPEVSDWIQDISSGNVNLYFLIDVYFGPHARKEYALGFPVYERAKSLFANAKFAFLSQAGPGRIEPDLQNFVERETASGVLDRLEAHDTPKVFPKYKVEEESTSYKKLPSDLLDWFDERRPPDRASNWDVQKWRELRRITRERCELLGNKTDGRDPVGHALWAHHLPYGGNRWPHSYDDRIEGWTNDLRNRLERLAPETKSFPDHGWAFTTEDGVQAWDRPPIRALAQFDNMGRDLMTALYLVKKDVRRLSQGDLKVRFASSLMIQPPNLDQDYLWFNISALANGLYILAQNFYHEVSKIQNEESNPTDLPVPCAGGRVFWGLEEFNEKGRLGLRIRVHQILIGWSVDSDDSFPCLVTHRYPFPDTATKTVKEAYGYLKLSGGSLRTDNGALVVEVEAKDVAGVWEIAG